MRWWRHGRLVQAVAMVLLFWTALDLGNASLCALDNERHAVVADATDAMLESGWAGHVPAQAPPQHVDDCFCCSHCVDVQAWSPASLSIPADLQYAASVPAAPSIFGSPLYHPPLV